MDLVLHASDENGATRSEAIVRILEFPLAGGERRACALLFVVPQIHEKLDAGEALTDGITVLRPRTRWRSSRAGSRDEPAVEPGARAAAGAACTWVYVGV